MVSRLEVKDDEDAANVRREFDGDLGVLRWQVPGGNRIAEVEIEEGAPGWWAGDEEASQASLQAMRAMGANV